MAGCVCKVDHGKDQWVNHSVESTFFSFSLFFFFSYESHNNSAGLVLHVFQQKAGLRPVRSVRSQSGLEAVGMQAYRKE